MGLATLWRVIQHQLGEMWAFCFNMWQKKIFQLYVGWVWKTTSTLAQQELEIKIRCSSLGFPLGAWKTGAELSSEKYDIFSFLEGNLVFEKSRYFEIFCMWFCMWFCVWFCLCLLYNSNCCSDCSIIKWPTVVASKSICDRRTNAARKGCWLNFEDLDDTHLGEKVRCVGTRVERSLRY